MRTSEEGGDDSQRREALRLTRKIPAVCSGEAPSSAVLAGVTFAELSYGDPAAIC